MTIILVPSRQAMDRTGNASVPAAGRRWIGFRVRIAVGTMTAAGTTMDAAIRVMAMAVGIHACRQLNTARAIRCLAARRCSVERSSGLSRKEDEVPR